MADWGWCHVSDADKTSVLEGVADGGCHGGPFHAEIQLTDRCNLDCGFCCTRRFREQAELSLKEITRIAGELKNLGCHSVTLNGGGEPLLHRDIGEALLSFSSAGLSINHLTTNGTLLSPRVADLLIGAGCDEVIVSLNAATPQEYATLMGTSSRHFQRVTDNIRTLIAMRNEASTETPKVVIQFLVHAGNVSSIPEMYRTAVVLRVDKVIFNDITGKQWTVEPGTAEFVEQIEAYREILRVDHDRGIASIHSHNVDIAAHLDRQAGHSTLRSYINDTVRRVRAGNLFARIVARRKRKVQAELREKADCCITPWHSMTIRPTGEVPVCCALQDRVIARIGADSVADIWHGPAFARVRQQIRRSMRDGEDWRYVPERDTDIVDFCASNCARDRRCRFRSYYFSYDVAFLRQLTGAIDDLRCRLA
jgi:MoaA/NifB/PqqE/SkfB family radical SAM enzyme